MTVQEITEDGAKCIWSEGKRVRSESFHPTLLILRDPPVTRIERLRAILKRHLGPQPERTRGNHTASVGSGRYPHAVLAISLAISRTANALSLILLLKIISFAPAAASSSRSASPAAPNPSRPRHRRSPATGRNWRATASARPSFPSATILSPAAAARWFRAICGCVWS